jgi:Holliday junction DNA helicase RuvA
MIAHLRGIVAGVAPDGAVIEVGGVGLRVQCTPDTLATLRPGEPAQVSTSLVVREDSLAMLAVHSPDALRRAVATEDLNALILVPGIGKKGAQRIVLEMRDRLGSPGDGIDGLPGLRPSSRVPAWREQVQTGLVNLGWPARDAELAIAAVEEDGTISGSGGADVDVATVLRAALRKLSKQ